MKILLLGATGATGRWAVKHLLDDEHELKVIVRSTEKLTAFLPHQNLEIIQASLLNLSDTDLQRHVKDCSAVVSCLGHNLTFKGLFGKPRLLVTDAARRLCAAVEANSPSQKVRYVLMNTTGNRNRDLKECNSFSEKVVMTLLRLLLPPQADNEKAADFLRTQIGAKHSCIEWAAVRPDNLIDEEEVSNYELYQSPIRSAIFNAGKTSRINVAHFMSELATSNTLWEKWKGQMPVIYNT